MMKKGFGKGFCSGILVAALTVGLGVSAMAASRTITVDDNIRITLNGAVFSPKDAKGRDVPLFSYNGTTYAPVRAICEAAAEPTCDWSLLEQPELPKVEVRHFQNQTGDHLRILNLYETRRMLYTLYNAIGDSSTTWENGAPKLTSKGNQLVHINLGFSEDLAYQMFWPWRESEIIKVFNGIPGTYSMQAWDVYKDGQFLHTEYQIRIN